MNAIQSSYPSREYQSKYLKKLRDDVGTLNPDRANVVCEYLPYTGIKTKTLDTLLIVRTSLEQKSDKTLYRKYQSEIVQFKSYLDCRIQQLMASQHCHHIDPWLELSTKTQAAKQSKLEEMSHHIHDVLDHCRMVAQFELPTEIQTAISEIVNLQRHVAQDYLVLLFGDAKPNESIVGRFNELPVRFEKIKKAFESQKFHEVIENIQSIQKELGELSDRM